MAEHLSYGVQAEGLTPVVMDEGKEWRFLGIQAKNRAEWNITNLAGFFQKVTTVAFYDTLGSDAMRFMCNQTELTTVAMSEDMVGKFAKLKLQDADSDVVKMHRVKNLIVFEDKVSPENAELAEKAGLRLLHWNALIAKGVQLKKDG